MISVLSLILKWNIVQQCTRWPHTPDQQEATVGSLRCPLGSGTTMLRSVNKTPRDGWTDTTVVPVFASNTPTERSVSENLQCDHFSSFHAGADWIHPRLVPWLRQVRLGSLWRLVPGTDQWERFRWGLSDHAASVTNCINIRSQEEKRYLLPRLWNVPIQLSPGTWRWR